jgi:cobalamin biosynthesis Mg chelatase CobN
MTEQNTNEGNENEQRLDDLLRQLAESQGEGDALFMFGEQPVDETKVDEVLLQEMIELDEIVKAKMTDWESRFDEDVLANTAAKLNQL